jgi:hypothetical protein
MESLPFFLTYLILFTLAIGVFVGFLSSLPIALVGILMLVHRKYFVKETNPEKFRLPMIIIFVGVAGFFVLGHQILHFLNEFLR